MRSTNESVSEITKALAIKDIYNFTIFDKIRDIIKKDALIDLKESEIDEVESIFKNVFLSHKLLISKFYKNENSKSVELMMSKSFLAMFDGIKNKLTRNFSGRFKYKSQYLSKNHLNFFNIDSNGNAEAYNELEFIKIYSMFIYIVYREGRYRLQNKVYEASACLHYVLINISEKIVELNRDVLDFDSTRNITRDLCYNNGLYLSKKSELSIYDDMYESLRKDELTSAVRALMNTFYRKKPDNIAISKLINTTFDYNSRLNALLNSNTKVQPFKYTNPISGFVSIKNSRVKLPSSKLTDEEVQKLAAENTELNSLFESVNNRLTMIREAEKKKNEEIIKIVEGDEIVALYNMRSYKKEIGSGGTLFNSCMRGSEVTPRIKFYANNPHFIKLLTLTTGGGKLLMARALAWYDKNEDVYYIDRIFYNKNASKLSMIRYINSQKNMYNIYRGESNSELSEKTKSYFQIEIDRVNNSDIINTPYFDSLSSYVKVENEKIYIGRFESTSPSTGGKFYDMTTFDGIKKIGKINTCKCDICNKHLSDPVKITDGSSTLTTCRKHIKKTEDGLIYVSSGNSESYAIRFLSIYKSTAKKYAYYIAESERGLSTKKENISGDLIVIDNTKHDIIDRSSTRSLILEAMRVGEEVVSTGVIDTSRREKIDVGHYVYREDGSYLVANKGLFRCMNIKPAQGSSTISMAIPNVNYISNNIKYFKNICLYVAHRFSSYGIQLPIEIEKELLIENVEKSEQSAEIKANQIKSINNNSYRKINNSFRAITSIENEVPKLITYVDYIVGTKSEDPLVMGSCMRRVKIDIDESYFSKEANIDADSMMSQLLKA